MWDTMVRRFANKKMRMKKKVKIRRRKEWG